MTFKLQSKTHLSTNETAITNIVQVNATFLEEGFLYLLISQTQTDISVNIPITNALATMPDVEMPLKNFRAIYTYMLGEKAFPTLNTSKRDTESKTTKRRPNLQNEESVL